MASLLVKYILVIFHIVTAAAWFGLALRVAGRARLVLRLDGTAARLVAEDNHRSVRLMNLFAALTFVFAVGAFFAGGGFYVYGSPYHTSLILIAILAAVQFFLITPTSAGLLATAESSLAREENAATYTRRLIKGVGIGHFLWVLMLVLMFWNRLKVVMRGDFGF